MLKKLLPWSAWTVGCIILLNNNTNCSVWCGIWMRDELDVTGYLPSEFPSQGISVLSILAPLCSHEWLISRWSMSRKQDRMIVLVRERHQQTAQLPSWLSSLGVTTQRVWISRWQKAGRLGDKSLIGCCVWIPWLSLSSIPSLGLGLHVSVQIVKCLQDGKESCGCN